MKKLLLIVGIAAIAAGVLCLLFGALNLFGYYAVLDGSAALYDRLYRNMVLFPLIGIGFAAAGTVCLIVRRKR